MFHNLFVKIASLIVAGLIGLGLYSTSIIENKIQQNLGADTTLPIAGITYTLSGSGISGSATSIGLSSLTIPQTGREIVDADLSSTFYITLEPGSRTRQEIVSCTTVSQSGSDNTATLSDCTRGLLPFTPYTASSTYQFAHAGRSSVVFSNPPQLYNEFTSKGNDETITGIWSFPEPTTASSTATKNYADNLSFAGVSDSSLTQKGIVEMANKTEMANGSSTGGTTAPLFVPAQYFNATSSATSTVPVSGSNGKLSSGFIDQTANYTWSGTTVFSGNVSSTGSNSFATTSVQGVNVGSHLSKFGGDGSDGALNIANGTSTITLTSPMPSIVNICTDGAAFDFRRQGIS